MNFLAQLRKTDPSSPVAYHLEGLVESQANIQSLLAKLDSLEEIDRESRAKALTRLQVEIYSHLTHHLRELRRPLKSLVDKIYKELPDLGPGEAEEVGADLDDLLKKSRGT